MTDKKFKWNMASAGNKLLSGITFNVSTPTPIVSISKSFDITSPHNIHTDAYRNCSNCHRHINYHTGGVCPK